MSTKKEAEKERSALLTELDQNRNQVTRDLSNFGESLNFNRRFEDSVRRHPMWWIGGGLAAGILVSKALSSSHAKPKGKEEKTSAARFQFLGLLGLAGREILRLSAPTLKRAAEHQLENWIANHLPEDDETPGRPNDPESA